MPHYILDYDPGHDDAIALLFAAKHLSLSGITTVFGNTNVNNTTNNALALVSAAELKIPVAKGAAAPLSGKIESAESVHGKNGLDGANLPNDYQHEATQSAAELLIDAARTKNDLVITAIAPLTNLAIALKQAPDIAQRIQEISVMEGSTGGSVMLLRWQSSTYSRTRKRQRLFYRVVFQYAWQVSTSLPHSVLRLPRWVHLKLLHQCSLARLAVH